jgi:hypothetical protein
MIERIGATVADRFGVPQEYILPIGTHVVLAIGVVFLNWDFIDLILIYFPSSSLSLCSSRLLRCFRLNLLMTTPLRNGTTSRILSSQSRFYRNQGRVPGSLTPRVNVDTSI